MNKVLILTSFTGSGHYKCAEAIKKAIKKLCPNTQTLIVDLPQIYHLSGKLVNNVYHRIIRITPKFYSVCYDSQFVSKLITNVVTAKKYLKRAEILIKKYQPDIIISTQLIPHLIVSMLKEKQKIKLPLITVITDYNIHNSFISNTSKYVDLYVIPNKEFSTKLIKANIKKESILDLGIPIDPKFCEQNNEQNNKQNNKSSIKKKFGLDTNLPVILVLGGGKGLGPIKKIIVKLNKLKLNFQIIVVTGKNKLLKKRLEKLTKKFSKPTRIFGYVKNMPEFYDVADLVISKPGGLTVSEILAKGLPLLIVKSLPGQEEKNTQFLLKTNAAVKLQTNRDFEKIVADLLSNKKKLKEIKLNLEKLSKPYAAMEIAQIIQKRFLSD